MAVPISLYVTCTVMAGANDFPVLSSISGWYTAGTVTFAIPYLVVGQSLNNRICYIAVFVYGPAFNFCHPFNCRSYGFGQGLYFFVIRVHIFYYVSLLFNVFEEALIVFSAPFLCWGREYR